MPPATPPPSPPCVGAFTPPPGRGQCGCRQCKMERAAPALFAACQRMLAWHDRLAAIGGGPAWLIDFPNTEAEAALAAAE